MPRKYTDAQLIEAVPLARSIAQVLTLIGLRAAGGNYKTIKRRIEELGLDTSHLTGQGWLRGSNIRTTRDPKPLHEILTEDSYYQSHRLKQRLLKEGLKDRVCESCRLTRWKGRPVPLELDHINGRNNDNRLNNLRLVCPNCHAQTSTYRGKNKKVS